MPLSSELEKYEVDTSHGDPLATEVNCGLLSAMSICVFINTVVCSVWCV